MYPKLPSQHNSETHAVKWRDKREKEQKKYRCGGCDVEMWREEVP